jgi:4-amino-4-deoxy-L-arabinose transferase-like glycosyltransferase
VTGQPSTPRGADGSAAGSGLASGTAGGWLLAAYCAIVFLANLGAAPLTDVDEGAFSEATREMLERGDFVTTYLNGALRFDKPILTYWLQAVVVHFAGPVAWAFRLPSALAAGLWVFLLYRFARRYAPGSATMAGFMLASALGPVIMARAATADALLNAFVAGALFAFYAHLRDGRRADLVEAFGWMGLGLLTKGPIALLVPALAVGTYCLSRREWLRPLALLRDPLAWLLMLAIAVPWYALELRAQGQAFIDGFILKHNVNRFTATMLGHGGRLVYYLPIVPLLAFPFLAPLAGALAGVRASWRDDLARFCWCAFVPMFVFFSTSRTQLPHYMLYGMTPLFLLLALNRHRFASALALVAPSVLGLAAVAALPWAVATYGPGLRVNAWTRLLLQELPAGLSSLVVPALAVAVALVLLAFLVRGERAVAADRRLYLAGALPAFFMVGLAWPSAVDWFQSPVTAAGAFARGQPWTIVQWNANWPSFSVHRRAATPARKPEPGEVVLTRFDRTGELPPHDVLFARREVVLARVRPSP